MMIVSRLMGGLGNQMFQYAAGKRLALRRGTELRIDLSWFETQSDPRATRRVYELDCFALEDRMMGRRELKWLELKGKIAPQLRLRIVPERTLSFDPSILDATDNSVLTGYWQSEEYFRDEGPVIRSAFRFEQPPRGKNADLLRKIEACQASVSLHVRRDDYVTKWPQFVPARSYYQAAIREIYGRVQDPHVFVFSDDAEWCRENLDLGVSMTIVDHNPPTAGPEDMRLMIACRHHVIANSSFSWWGAWLDATPEKIVIAPKKWLPSRPDTSDVVPDAWIRL